MDLMNNIKFMFVRSQVSISKTVYGMDDGYNNIYFTKILTVQENAKYLHKMYTFPSY